MHYVAVVDGEEHEVEIVEIAPGHFQLFMGDRKLEVDAHPVAPETLSCIIDGEVFDVSLHENPKGGEDVRIRDHELRLEVLDLRRMRLRQAQDSSGALDGPAEIASPMPGKVVAVLVKNGDKVSEGQGLLVVEAMKMENELKAPKDGEVQSLQVQEGAAIDGGTVLCVVA